MLFLTDNSVCGMILGFPRTGAPMKSTLGQGRLQDRLKVYVQRCCMKWCIIAPILTASGYTLFRRWDD